jgi:hypothetical protein
MLLVLTKTQLGLEFLKDRRSGLSPRQRSAFILFDGKRSTRDILAATAPMGITADDVATMVTQQLLEPVAATETSVAATAAAKPARSATGATGAAPASEPSVWPASLPEGATVSDRSAQERYQSAYKVATELTASLGLRGFRLNLAVEGSSNYDDLVALAPKIRDAVGAERCSRLDDALFA